MLIRENARRSRAEAFDDSEGYRSTVDVCGPVTPTLLSAETCIDVRDAGLEGKLKRFARHTSGG